MMLLRKAIVPVLVLLAAATFSYGQATQGSSQSGGSQGSGPTVVLEYFDDQSQITVTNSAGAAYQFVSFGMTLGPGDKVVTQNSSAELRMDPNGSIIKLAPNTQFVVDTLEGSAGATTNQFSLLGGRLRTIAAKVAGASYEVRTNTAVGGVRGTDFGMEVIPGQSDSLFVKEGTVEFTKIASGQSLTLNAGDFADALANTFQVVKLSTQQLNDLFNSLAFKQLDPTSVPGHQAAQSQETAPANASTGTTTTPSTGTTTASSGSTKPGVLDGVMKFLANYLGMQIGGVTIDGQTYSQLIFQPAFHVGKLKAALYLPVIYSSNLFDANDWYHPAGNNEWSFGIDYFSKSDILGGLKDLASDLFLKIRYVEYGQQRDPFFLKVGNLNDMTLGHGVIVRNFANDADFPAVRKVGVNLGLDGKVVGFEGLVNDLANPQIFGARLYFRPFAKSFPMAFGFSGVTDISPASTLPLPADLPAGTPAGTSTAIQATETADPLFLNVGSDIDLPIVSSDPFSIIAFGDVAGMLPYIRTTTTLNGTSIGQGFKVNALIDTSGGFRLRNYGIASGVFGNIFGLDYRLEYRNYNGVFRPAFYDASYERLRGSYAVDLMQYLSNPSDPQYQNVTMGIYGEAGFTLLKLINFQAGYMWPWTWDSSGNIQFGTDDYLKLQLGVDKGLIPLGISASISYERTKFIPMLLNDPSRFGQLTPFDANTVLQGQVTYPIAPTMNIVLAISTTAKHDDSGNVVYDANGNPIIVPSVSIETQIGY